MPLPHTARCRTRGLTHRLTRRLTAGVLAAAALAGAACKDPASVPDLNNLPDDLVTGPLNGTAAQLLVTGLVNRDRAASGFRYLVFGATLARDVYNIDPSEDRFQTELLGSAIDPGGFVGAGGGTFAEAYNGILVANALIARIATAADLTPAERRGVQGIAHTFKALALYRALELRGANGVPLDASPLGATREELFPVRCAPAALTAISATLDSGATELADAGAAFAVRLPAGFSSDGDFDTPAGFLRFNRGLKGRAELYRGLAGGGAAAFTAAVVALDASFLDPAAPLGTGVYQTYAAPPDLFNPIAVNTVFLNPTVTAPPAGSGLAANGQALQPGDRRGTKVVPLAAPVTRNGVTATFGTPLATADAANLTRRLPVLRNAELLLLRAQARLELGRFEGATADLNVVRAGSGRGTPG